MITVAEAKAKALKHFDRHCRRWAAELFCDAIGMGDAAESEKTAVPSDACGSQPLRLPGIPFSLVLHPPTERQVLADISASKAWVRSWREGSHCEFVRWTAKEWASVGQQEVPTRLVISDPQRIAEFSGKGTFWATVRRRTFELATRWNIRWSGQVAHVDGDALRSAITRVAAGYGALPPKDWKMLLPVLDWLIKNPDADQYVRQLPVRGIDGKWIEKHKGTVEPLFCAMTGKERFGFCKVPHQIRVRFLDAALAPAGIDDLSLTPQALNRYPEKPEAVLICENLVSVMALPELSNTLALFGGGYGIGALAEVEWLAQMPLLYWGDLDTNGFAILNRLRHYFPHARSLMMDTSTLDTYRDLAVIEPTPNRGTFELLTSDEQATLRLLDTPEGFLRLEQERIEWRYAVEQIMQAREACA